MKKAKEKKLKIAKKAKIKAVEGMAGCGKSFDQDCGINARQG